MKEIIMWVVSLTVMAFAAVMMFVALMAALAWVFLMLDAPKCEMYEWMRPGEHGGGVKVLVDEREPIPKDLVRICSKWVD